jgi:pSer/pThr/pTyr-binding forkhead associated (FHA) protein
MKIELTATDSRKRKIVVDQFPVIVGLDPGADICLDDSAVGHYQCMIDLADDGLTLWDLGTKSGTYINGARVQKKHPLADGDELTIGRHTFLLHCDQPDGHPRPRQAPSSQSESHPSHSSARHAEPAVT